MTIPIFDKKGFTELAQIEAETLVGASFAGLDLSNANMIEMDLRKADFSGANLSHADLRLANLEGACFRGANLSGADLSNARVDGADFSGAIRAEEGTAVTSAGATSPAGSKEQRINFVATAKPGKPPGG